MGSRCRTCRSLAARVAVFGLLGAAVNVAVAWSFAICFDIWSNDDRWIEQLGLTWEQPEGNQITWRVGFPLRSLACEWQADGWPIPGTSIEVPTPLPDRYAFKGNESTLPLRPLWLGFVVDSMFYAGILWPLFAAPFALRRRRRIKRGLCPVCAYPVGASDLCTECGKPVAPKSIEPVT